MQIKYKIWNCLLLMALILVANMDGLDTAESSKSTYKMPDKTNLEEIEKPEKIELWEVVPTNEKNFNILKRFVETNSAGIDVWQQGVQPKQPWLIYMYSDIVGNIWKSTRALLDEHAVLVDKTSGHMESLLNERLLNNARRHKYNTMASSNTPSHYASSVPLSKHTYYRNADEVGKFLKDCADRNRSAADLSIIGQTYERRPIYMMEIASDKSKSKPYIWIEAGIHAREWISPASTLFVIDKLLSNNFQANKLLQRFNFRITPLINPDGYQYTHTRERMWRKNRSPNKGSSCIGVDLNRNFDKDWAVTGSSANPCEVTYHGPHANSELEVQALVKEVSKISRQLKFYLSLHSFGQYILFPYGTAKNYYTSEHDKTVRMTNNVKNKLQSKYYHRYKVGSIADVMYPASGGSIDYMADNLKVAQSVTVELPDKGRFGFTLPPNYIYKVGNELWDILNWYAEYF